MMKNPRRGGRLSGRGKLPSSDGPYDRASTGPRSSKLLMDFGEACAEYQSKTLANLPASGSSARKFGLSSAPRKRTRCEEKKAKGRGDAWKWVAIDAETKLVPCWFVGPRDAARLNFIHELKNRLANRVQFTTDGNRCYLYAIEDAFGAEVDYAMLVKITARGQARRCVTTLRSHGRVKDAAQRQA